MKQKLLEEYSMLKKTLRILSIDGGGIRGVIPAMFMMEIEKRTGKRIAELFHLIAGSSTGGILTLGMTVPGADGKPRYTARDGLHLYENEGPVIFKQTAWQTISSLANMVDEKYMSAPVEGVLERYFGEARLRDSLTDVLITSYDIERRIPWFFRSKRAITLPEYDFPMKFVARATSAAPTYFETARINTEDGTDYYPLIDGAVFANNPAMCAYVDALRHYPEYDEVLVVSLGTGQYTRRIPYDRAKDWGLVEWVRPIIDILMHGVNETVDYQMQTMLPIMPDGTQHYYRMQVVLDPYTDKMDDVSPGNMRSLRLLAEEFIRDNEFTFDRLCRQLTE
jgi:patatin-like phospholipase/acyl hydrolase